MRPAERGFLLLSCKMGDPERRVLTPYQMKVLAHRVSNQPFPNEARDVEVSDLMALGYNRELAQRVVNLLSEEDRLDYYLSQGRKRGCIPLTRVSEGYPLILRKRLGLEAPGCIWLKGERSLLDTPAIALVGSRDLREENRQFAETVGHYAAEAGLTLVSGNARGADRVAQNACLAAGGRVIAVVADPLTRCQRQEQVLYLSEDDFDEPFSAQRALSRNRCIHALGRMVFVAQSDIGHGGTWDGTTRNLRCGWSPVACFRDGSEAAKRLEDLGAFAITREEVGDLDAMPLQEQNFLDRE